MSEKKKYLEELENKEIFIKREVTDWKGTILNITGIFTPVQVENVAKAVHTGAPSIISVFAGRIADTGRDPIPIMEQTIAICDHYGSESLWASPREFYNIIRFT